MSLASDKRAALSFVQRRGYKGSELPKGRPGNAAGCPIALALGPCQVQRCGDEVEIWYGPSAGKLRVAQAPAVVRFIGAFDRRRYPELVV